MLKSLVESAFEYAYPLHAMARTRWRAVQDPANPQRHAPNTVQHIRTLADHRCRWITAPNNDTLYSNAWLDLAHGPVRLSVAAQPARRYWSVALLDAFTNHVAVLGQRLDGPGPVSVTLLGPGHHAAQAAGRVIRAAGNDAWLFGRWLVDGLGDLPQAHASTAMCCGFPPATFPPIRFGRSRCTRPRPTASAFFAANPMGRYAIGNRTPGLVHQANGALEIVLQHTPPAAASEHANWLPAPPGPFQIVLRAYLPRPALRRGEATMPVIVRVGKARQAPRNSS